MQKIALSDPMGSAIGAMAYLTVSAAVALVRTTSTKFKLPLHI
jgi:hypothetical protein